MHATVGSNIVRLVKMENGRIRATYRDLNTHWDTPGWLYFDIEYDHVISCLGWRYVKPDIFDETIEIGEYLQVITCCVVTIL